jgi:hypothetical protein
VCGGNCFPGTSHNRGADSHPTLCASCEPCTMRPQQTGVRYSTWQWALELSTASASVVILEGWHEKSLNRKSCARHIAAKFLSDEESTSSKTVKMPTVLVEGQRHMSSSLPPATALSLIAILTSLSSNTGPCPSHRASFFNLSQTSPTSTSPFWNNSCCCI